VEDGLTLDINKLVRDGNIRSGVWCKGTLSWTRVASGVEVGSIGYEANLTDACDAWIRLHYRVDGESRDYRIILETTQPYFGGQRWWFRCPSTGRRVAKLHSPPGGDIFASRRAYDLAYRSQRERAHERKLTRAQYIRTRLGGSPSLVERFPDKPKGMWWRTYERLRAEANPAEMQSWIGVAERFGFEL
jgi:hypothetical protein